MNNKKILAPGLRFNGFDGEWTIKTLDEIVKVIDCKHRTPEYVENGVPVVSPGTIKWGEIDLLSPTKRVIEAEYESLMDHCAPKKGDLVFSRNQSIGIASILFNEDKFVLGQDTVLIQAKTVDPIFNYYRLQTNPVQTLISKLSGGSTFARINLKDLRKLKVTIVDSKSEQQKIASFLSSVDEKIQQLTRKKKLLEQYKKGVMQQLFSGKLRFKDENGKAFPKWEEKKIAAVCVRSSSKSKSIDIIENGVNIIVDMGSISRDCKLIGIKRTNCQDDYLETDELVMAKDDIGGGNIIGKVVMIPENNKYVCGDHVYRLKVIKGDVTYIYYSINSFEINKSFRRKANGTAQIGISNKTVDEQYISFPLLEEQKKIADYLYNIDNKIEILNKQITQTQTFKKSLLQQMFV